MFATAAAAGDPHPGGLWIHHEKWVVGYVDDGDVHKSASAAIVNFCPHGVFRLATGVVYQSTKSNGVGIGASDGLKIYKGRWSRENGKLIVEYRLAGAELMNVSDDLAKNPWLKAELTAVGRRLGFPFTTVYGRTWPMTLVPAARYEKFLMDWFVECGAKPH